MCVGPLVTTVGYATDQIIPAPLKKSQNPTDTPAVQSTDEEWVGHSVVFRAKCLKPIASACVWPPVWLPLASF